MEIFGVRKQGDGTWTAFGPNGQVRQIYERSDIDRYKDEWNAVDQWESNAAIDEFNRDFPA